MSHVFDAAIALAPTAGHTFSGATPAACASRVGPYGGTSCALLASSQQRVYFKE